MLKVVLPSSPAGIVGNVAGFGVSAAAANMASSSCRRVYSRGLAFRRGIFKGALV